MLNQRRLPEDCGASLCRGKPVDGPTLLASLARALSTPLVLYPTLCSRDQRGSVSRRPPVATAPRCGLRSEAEESLIRRPSLVDASPSLPTAFLRCRTTLRLAPIAQDALRRAGARGEPRRGTPRRRAWPVQSPQADSLSTATAAEERAARLVQPRTDCDELTGYEHVGRRRAAGDGVHGS